jgi:hypothetical protein
MSSDTAPTASELLVSSIIKMVGKREFLKTVERLFPTKSGQVKGERKVSTRRPPPTEEQQCCAMVKGQRTGAKMGRNVLYFKAKCPRHKSGEGDVCIIHKNHTEKYGALPFGLFTDPLSEDMKKVFEEA